MASYVFDAKVFVDGDTLQSRLDAEAQIQKMLNEYFDMTDDTATIRIKILQNGL